MRKDLESARPVLVLSTAVVAAMACAVALPSPLGIRPSGAVRPVPLIEPAGAYIEAGSTIRIACTQGDRLLIASGADAQAFVPYPGTVALAALPDARSVARTLSVPTSLGWRHPLPGLPGALVLRAAQAEGERAAGPVAMRTFLFERHGLPVVSILAEEEGLYGGSDGIAVVGEGILRMPEPIQRSYARDPRWWKYPGNFHGRGKAWGRRGRVQLIDESGSERFQAEAEIRINGQMTRGFPQHAWRLAFDEPLPDGVFADGAGRGARALVLRAAGNDQVKAMLRDAYQHALCAGAEFGTSESLTCVAYINGAYQGIHHLRPRMDAAELARRNGIPLKKLALLEDRSVPVHGDSSEAKRFARMVWLTEHWEEHGAAWADSLERLMDVDGFLAYMASQMLLGNMDWPRQNVKYWRYTGKPEPDGPRDGRWRFVMGDSDLGFGAIAGPEEDLFAKVRGAEAPISRLFLAMLEHRPYRQRFAAIALRLLDGPFAPARSLHVLDSLAGRMAPEMERHTARWRKPAHKAAWEREIGIMRTFAQERPGHARRQLEGLLAKP